MSFVDRAALEPGCSVLLHSKGMQVVGLLADEADPAVSVMKVEHAPTETYADVGGLEAQVQEIKEAVELPLTHPELYEDIGVRPPKVRLWLGWFCCVGGRGLTYKLRSLPKNIPLIYLTHPTPHPPSTHPTTTHRA